MVSIVCSGYASLISVLLGEISPVEFLQFVCLMKKYDHDLSAILTHCQSDAGKVDGRQTVVQESLESSFVHLTQLQNHIGKIDESSDIHVLHKVAAGLRIDAQRAIHSINVVREVFSGDLLMKSNGGEASTPEPPVSQSSSTQSPPGSVSKLATRAPTTQAAGIDTGAERKTSLWDISSDELTAITEGDRVVKILV